MPVFATLYFINPSPPGGIACLDSPDPLNCLLYEMVQPPIHRHTSEILQVPFQTIAIKSTSQQSEPNEFCGFPGHIKAMFT